MHHLIEAEMRRWTIPGLSLAVVRDRQVVCAAGFGWANRERSKPAAPHTVYPLASITKTFVATAVMMLVEDGALELDRAITEILPGLPPAWARIRVKHLLAHTSGIKDCYAHAGFGYYTPATVAERIGAVARLPLASPPGCRTDYSNTGYLLLGEIIAAVSGQSYDSFLAGRVFRPLGMTQTRVNDPRAADENGAVGYAPRFGWKTLGGDLVAVDAPHHLAAGSADGGLVSTVVDLAAWDVALSSGRVLRPASLRQMWAPAKWTSGRDGWLGLGWCLDEYKGAKIVFHGGGDPGFATCFCRWVDEGVTVVLLANRGGHYRGFPLVVQTLGDIVSNACGDRQRYFGGMHGGIHDAVFGLARRIGQCYRTPLPAQAVCRGVT
jgi:CubicO group peptidase (beta-lactamase class C family)